MGPPLKKVCPPRGKSAAGINPVGFSKKRAGNAGGGKKTPRGEGFQPGWVKRGGVGNFGRVGEYPPTRLGVFGTIFEDGGKNRGPAFLPGGVCKKTLSEEFFGV